MPPVLRKLRESIHPVYRLRRHRLGRVALQACDVSYWASIGDVEFKVRARVVSHAGALRLRGGTEPGIFALLRAIGEVLRPACFWDVGANIGYYSWLFKSWFPDTRVALFEPDPSNARLIEQTLRRAGLDGITLHRFAVSDISGIRNFVTDEVSGFTGSLAVDEEPFALRHWHAEGRGVMVHTLRLDDARSNQNQSVDLIKMDVEGHEEAAFRGGGDTIAHDKPVIIYECFHESSPIVDFLKGLGYSIFDAEWFATNLRGASNFLALPEHYQPALERLTSRWEQEMALVDK